MNYRETVSYKTAIRALHPTGIGKTPNEPPPYANDASMLGIRTYIYKYLIDDCVGCHWHDDFEYGMLLNGSVDLSIDNIHTRLEKGDVFFINSNILHMSRQPRGGKDAVMCALSIPTSLLPSNGSGSIGEKYLKTLSNSQIGGFVLSGKNPVTGKLSSLLMNIYELDPSSFGYELQALSYFYQLWLATLKYVEDDKSNLLHQSDGERHTERMKKILSYIHAHFNEKITAADIADHATISRGECFRCFKRYMNKTLVEYVNEYRLQQATKLLRETERSLTEISLDCGFENASYFGKLFKEAYSMAPSQYRKARIWTDNALLNINSYDYEYWKDSGSGTMIITANANNGSFSCEWQGVNNITFRSGKKFRHFDRTHKQLGRILLQFDAAYHSLGCSFLSVYGWTVDPLVEWYIVECYTQDKPSMNLPLLDTLDADDGTYELYRTTVVDKASILGTRTFEQCWSVRTSGRLNGTADVSAHLRTWEGMGMEMGKIAEVALSVEGILSSGHANVKTNILTFTGQ